MLEQGETALPHEAEDVAPEAYHQTLCPPVAEPAFETKDEMVRVWGRQWGASDDVGRLRSVLMRQPGKELAQVRADAWNGAARALVDPNGGWYWTSPEPPDLELIHEQHKGLVDVLEREGVEVHLMDPLPQRFTKAMYTRDPLITVPGGAVIGRMAPLMRRGEERSVFKTLGELGVPVLRTVTGTGLLEGGSFAKLRPGLAAFGTSIRCNEVGAEQLREVLHWIGYDLIVVAMCGFSIHLDGHFLMVDVDKALVNPPGLPHWFLERLRSLGIEAIYRHPEERWAVNVLAVRPGRVLMSSECNRTMERLEKRGVEVIPIPYDEIEKNGGGIHCSTMELQRDSAE